MTAEFKPWNFLPLIVIVMMAVLGLISWWVALAIFIGGLTLQR
jgi:hypothetical protein